MLCISVTGLCLTIDALKYYHLYVKTKGTSLYIIYWQVRSNSNKSSTLMIAYHSSDKENVIAYHSMLNCYIQGLSTIRTFIVQHWLSISQSCFLANVLAFPLNHNGLNFIFEHDDDWHIFDVETDFARQFDLQSLCQWWKDWSFKKGM